MTLNHRYFLQELKALMWPDHYGKTSTGGRKNQGRTRVKQQGQQILERHYQTIEESLDEKTLKRIGQRTNGLVGLWAALTYGGTDLGEVGDRGVQLQNEFCQQLAVDQSAETESLMALAGYVDSGLHLSLIKTWPAANQSWQDHILDVKTRIVDAYAKDHPGVPHKKHSVNWDELFDGTKTSWAIVDRWAMRTEIQDRVLGRKTVNHCDVLWLQGQVAVCGQYALCHMNREAARILENLKPSQAGRYYALYRVDEVEQHQEKDVIAGFKLSYQDANWPMKRQEHRELLAAGVETWTLARA